MTTLAKIDNTAVLAEFTGGSTTDVAMMIGIGLVKDSDAVFFQYLGEEQPAQALSYPSGKPVTRMANVRLNGIEVVDGIGDAVVVLTNLAELQGVQIEHCIKQAYKVIAQRSGKMVNGTFKKD